MNNGRQKKLKERGEYVVSGLKRLYPDAKCSLEYKHPYELMIATRLSAQCTDARVNIVTSELFEKFPTLESFAEADVGDVRKIVAPCGLGNMKAQNIVDACIRLRDVYNGVLPDTMEELLTLAGVGRKTANLLLGDVFHKPAVVTDTHCIRISGRLGLTENKEPAKVEKDLREIIDPDESSDLCHRFVLFGREYCRARNPLCKECPLRKHLEENIKGFECNITEDN